MFKVVSSYRRSSYEGGRRRRNKGFWGQGLNTNGRRRSIRNSGIRLRWRGRGASEGKRGSDESGENSMRDRSKIGRGRRRNI
jgi:hypothetical protein